ncbi:Uncharacterized protein TCM_044329 [Theobroma cacao]|uniref:RNase H type-1 domain-containing protein n=1 Tax=Theobroma cacao TaxID=3641 RepID=A0A061FWW3_THECC|nr:Uncharacterized protein TCM_044329 [Theobroma cacao]
MIEGGFGSVKKKFKNTLNGVIDVESLMNLGHAFKNLDSYNGLNFIGSCDRIESKILVDRNLENGIDQVSAGFNVTLREVKSSFGVIVGNGLSISFWEDEWIKGFIVKGCFLRIWLVIDGFTLDIMLVPNLVKVPSKGPKVFIVVDLVAPLEEWMKFNVDGAARGNSGKVGIGGVLRNNLGEIKITCSNSIRVHDANFAELSAFA